MKPIGLNILTHSRMSCFKTCPRKHHYQYNLGIQRDRESAPLRFGGRFHQGLDWLAQGFCISDVILLSKRTYRDKPEWADEYEWQIEREKICVLLQGYANHWQNDGADIISTEESFQLPIRNPKTGRPSTRYRVAGKKDKIVRLADGRIAVMDHKTTSYSLDIGSDFWKQCELSPQCVLYFWAAQQAGVDVQTVVYDAIRKPGISPHRETPDEKKKYVKIGERKGLLHANQYAKDETVHEYGERLAVDIASRPDWYYRRQEYPKMRSDIDSMAQELWNQQKLMRWCFKNDIHPKNELSCTMPYRCEYLDVCHNGMNLDVLPEGFKQVANIHPELEDDHADIEGFVQVVNIHH